MMKRVPAAVGICAVVLLGLAVSACVGGGGYRGAATSDAATGDDATSDDCQPGVCVGSTPGSTPDHLGELAP